MVIYMYIMIKGTGEEKVQGLFTEGGTISESNDNESLVANSSSCFQKWR